MRALYDTGNSIRNYNILAAYHMKNIFMGFHFSKKESKASYAQLNLDLVQIAPLTKYIQSPIKIEASNKIHPAA